jgi:predicted helicase
MGRARWVMDQYRVSEDKASGIRSDPNRADVPEYIVKLVGRVIRVSLETVRLVKSLPNSDSSLYLPAGR